MSVKVKDVLDALQQMQKSLECSICLELLKDPHSTKCNHQFCGQCIRQVLEKSSKKSKNKWYCPLCKTPVSKRSLTPNPKLNEIVAAVRSLQGAVQDDTGVPTGSPPSQLPFKSSSKASIPGSSRLSIVNPTPQKWAVDGRSTRNVTRMKQFNVYIENNDNEQAVESKQPQVVTNTNIRSSLRPVPLTQTTAKSTKSKKVLSNTKTTSKTRNSRRIAERNQAKEISENNVSVELLHMIDTMSFKPVANGGPTCPTGDFILVPSTHDSKPGHDSSNSTTTTSTVNDNNTGSKETCHSTSVQQERTSCLTTIAEADSSIMTSPGDGAVFCRSNNFVLSENIENSKEGEVAVSSTKFDSGPQSSLNTMQSVSILPSLDRHEQQCEAVPDDDCHESQDGGNQQIEGNTSQGDKDKRLVSSDICGLENQKELCDAVPNDVCDDSREKDNHRNEDITCDGDEADEVISSKRRDLENQEEPRDAIHVPGGVCDEPQGKRDHQNDISREGDEANKIISPERCDMRDEKGPCDAATNDAHKKSQEGGLNEDIPFQGEGGRTLISTQCRDPGILNEPIEVCKEEQTNEDALVSSESVASNVKNLTEQSLDFEGLVSVFDDPSLSDPLEERENLETVNRNRSLGEPEKRVSPRTKGRGHADLQENRTEDSSDLCERVKQRQRRRTSEMLFNSNRHSRSPMRSPEWKTKAKKRSAEFVIDFNSRDVPRPEGRAKKKFKASEGPSPGQASPEMAITTNEKSQEDSKVSVTVKDDRRVLSDELGVDSYSCSSGKIVLSSEVVPPSVSSSDKSNSSVINPMIAHVNQPSEGIQGGAIKSKKGCDLQKKKEDDFGNVNEKGAVIAHHPHNLVASKENDKLQDKECAFNVQDSATDLTASQTSSPSQNAFACMTALQPNTSKHIDFNREETETTRVEDEETSRNSLSQKSTTDHKESLPCHPSEKTLLSTCDESSHFHEDVDINQKEQKASQVETADTQGLQHVSRTLQNLSRKQSYFINRPERSVSDNAVNNESQIEGKCSYQAAEADAKISQSLSQEVQYSSNPPTPSSLEVDAVTPCLFGNDSCETPDKKTNYRRTRKRQHLKSQREYSIEENSKNVPTTSRTLGLHKETNKENNTSRTETVDEADFERMDTLDDSQATIANAEHFPFSGVVRSPAGDRKESTAVTDPEGTQETSQSVSVLQDLEFPPQEEHECTNDNNELSGHSAGNSNTDAKDDNSWAEPLPKKLRESQTYSGSQKNETHASSNLKGDASTERLHGSGDTESEVIPPTPPVKPVTKQIFDSHAQSPLRLSRQKTKLQRIDEANSHPERLAVKQKRRIGSLRCSKSPKLQDRKDDVAGTCGSSAGSEPSEASVSLLASHSRSPRTVNAVAKSVSHNAEAGSDTSLSFSRKRLEPLQDRTAEAMVNNADVASKKSPKDLKRFPGSGSQKRVVENVSSQGFDDLRLSQAKLNHQVSQKGISAFTDSSPENSPSCSPVKRRADDIGDSFDWSGNRDTRKGSWDPQDAPTTFNKGGNDKDTHSTRTEDEHLSSVLLSPPKAKQADHEVDNSDEDFPRETEKEKAANPILDYNQNGDYLTAGDGGDDPRNEDDVGDCPCTVDDDDEGDSSGDEALLKPVFLPKVSTTNERTCSENIDDDDEEDVAVFSQELIPSENNDEDDDDEITSSCKALDSTGASSATFLSEAAASTQKMEVLRQDVEAMEKEMEELRAYLAKTDEKREGTEITIEDDDTDYQEDYQCDEPDMQPSLTPPPPLTPKSIPPMRQLSTPLKDVSRYLDQEGQSSDEGSESEDVTSNVPVDGYQRKESTSNIGNSRIAEKKGSGETFAKKRPLSPSYEDDGLSITTVEHRQEETPSPPRSNRSLEKSQEKNEDDLIVIEDRDGLDSRTGSLLLVKRRKITDDLIPKKSPVVSLLFTRAGKDSEKRRQSPRPVAAVTKKTSPFIYSRKRGSGISPIRQQDPPRPVSRDSVSRERASRQTVTNESVPRDNWSLEKMSSKSLTRESVIREDVSRNSVSRERVSRDQCQSPDLLLIKDVTNTKYDDGRENQTSSVNGTAGARHLSFVATRLNRQQLAEARILAETYGGKLASEFNSKTSHVIMATDENMQVTRHSYTMKYLLGLALGKWIVSHHWIAACQQAKALVPEADYEVKGDPGLGQTSIPRVARTARSNTEALLFEDYDVVCFGGFSSAVTKEQLSQLLKFCGARVYIDAKDLKGTEKGRRKVVTIDKETRDNDNEIKAICRQLNTKPVSLEWVTDSIANYKVQDLRDYIVEF